MSVAYIHCQSIEKLGESQPPASSGGRASAPQGTGEGHTQSTSRRWQHHFVSRKASLKTTWKFRLLLFMLVMVIGSVTRESSAAPSQPSSSAHRVCISPPTPGTPARRPSRRRPAAGAGAPASWGGSRWRGETREKWLYFSHATK